ncbi:MAG: hypothetical protein HOQ30_13585 [Gemmatimonadaceae bacterium]|nr:hypothetical protein [Gemmatimonadaceae bacterium]
MDSTSSWDDERAQLLGHRISELGLAIGGSRVERLVSRLNDELAARGVAFHPPVYLSDEWGCPDGTPLIGVPFYLADERLERIEAEHAGAIESDDEAMRYLRHEAGHAINYAFHLYERPEFATLFGDYGRPYAEHYPADPMSRDHVRHILGWYAQKHPDEDFAETFAVWLTPGLDWRTEYAGWGALRKLEWMDAVMREIGQLAPLPPELTDDDLPVDAMTWTVADHYAHEERLPIGDARQFDGDLRRRAPQRRRASRRRAISPATRGSSCRASPIGREWRPPPFDRCCARSRSVRRRSSCAAPASRPRR